MRVTHGETRESNNSHGSIIRTSVDLARASLVTIKRNGYVIKFFKKQSLPSSNEVELPDAVRKEVNSAVQKVLEAERHGANGRKRKYTHFTPEDRAKIAKYAVHVCSRII